MQIFADNKEV